MGVFSAWFVVPGGEWVPGVMYYVLGAMFWGVGSSSWF